MQRAAFIGFALAVLALAGAAGAGLGYRLEVWPLRAAFTILRGSAYGGISAAVLSLICAVWILRQGPYRGLMPALAGLILGAAVAAVPYSHLRTARTVPPIHDISTDLNQPPPFVEALAHRAGAPNAAAYGGESIARQQREAYPDIRPLFLQAPPAAAFARALAAARDLGWEIVAAAPSEGRIEATDRTFWFGFEDDVVVRIRAAGGGSLVDVRSVSRVGRSDVGTNARRIRRFLQRVAEGAGDR
ncbi:MAG TPA: DUF1499 domain-containing protein [Gammaproteobacteria bacterium]|nr:DUF1499 domain-containing protein [Gammaproteobacteria bacterium]